MCPTASPSKLLSPSDIKHKWGEPQSKGDITERPCTKCTLIKITAHPPHGLPYRAWRYANQAKWFRCEATPRCDPSGELASHAAQ